MTGILPGKGTLESFAGLLEYPCGGEAELAAKGSIALSGDFPDAASLLEGVSAFFAGTPLGRAEEIFTATFDLQAACAPYVGFHLFGEGYKRRVFLAGLSALYSSRGFSAGGELPDHVAVVLRFLADSPGDAQARELLHDGLIPSLAKMTGKFVEPGNPYGDVLRALRMVLLPGRREDAAEAPREQPETEAGQP